MDAKDVAGVKHVRHVEQLILNVNMYALMMSSTASIADMLTC